MYLIQARLADDLSVRALIPAIHGAGSHHAVWSLMTDGADRARDFLYRENDDGKLMVLSQRKPLESPLWRSQTRALPEFQAGDALRFSLRANPVIRRKRADGKTVKLDPIMNALHATPSGQRAEVRMQTAQDVTTDWLQRLGTQGGYELQSSVVETYKQRRIHRRGGRPVQFGVVDVVGELVVTDAEAFTDHLEQGFGASRAWGCGLMLVRRV